MPGTAWSSLRSTGSASRCERQASLALRAGQPDALAAYRSAGQVHPCTGGDTALDGVFAHWAHARTHGQDALMLARTRLDVDALNLRARAAALEAGQITGLVRSRSPGAGSGRPETSSGPAATTASCSWETATSAAATATRPWAPDRTTV